MTLPKQKRFSLDEAVEHIKKEANEPCTSNGLLQLAKQDEFKISFSLSNRDLSFVRLDKSGNRWNSKAYCPESAEEPVYVVLPFDLPEQFFNEQLTTNQDQVFPILDWRALSEFLASMENHTARIHPKKCNAFDEEGNVIEVAIVEQKWIPKNKEFNEWQDTVGFPREVNGGALKNEMYFEATDSLLINRSDLFLTRLELEQYIMMLVGLKSVINWEKWGRIETIYLLDACALLAGFDLAFYRWKQKDYQNSITEEEQKEKNKTYYPNRQPLSEFIEDEKREHQKAHTKEFIKLENIQAVINSHAKSGHFIDIVPREYKVDNLKAEGMAMEKVPEGETSVFIDTVNLAEFGTWAKSAGYELPPQFPVGISGDLKKVPSKTKRKNVSQLHTFIQKIDIALTNDGIKPTAQAVSNEIEKNHYEYDDEAIIREVKNNTIYWTSKGGKQQTLWMTSISATLSTIRKKY